jgi:Fe-S-cluster-containing dehydrogenase component
MRKERGQAPMVDVAYLPVPCMHCDNAPCVKNAERDAVYKRKDGIVIIDPVRSKKQRTLVDTCPYGAIWWNEEKEIPQKCTFCAHLLDEGWKEPRCVQACPTGALRVTRDDGNGGTESHQLKKGDVLHPEYKTFPRVFYYNLYRYQRCFIGGSVAVEKDGITECAEEAVVSLLKGEKVISELVTDNYGDFKFDNLEEKSGVYHVDITWKDSGRKRVDVDLKDSVYIGIVTFNLS